MNRLVSVLSLGLVLSLPAAAQRPGPASPGVAADVVVTAEAAPQEAADLAVATTVVDRAAIERSRAATVAELLRTVPGVDVVQSGGPGGVTSLFLRGANSNSALVLVDGVKVNSPYFGGVDLSSLGTANLERVEVVRGPFSALYGSEAIGGVVQLFTRKAEADGLSGRAHFGLGNASARDWGVNAALRDGSIGVSAGFRRGTTGGDLPNEFHSGSDLSAALDVQVAPDVKTGVTFRRTGGRLVLSHATARNRISVGADLERTQVTNEDSYGLQLDGLTTRTWSVFAEDRLSLAKDRLAVTAGVRRDEHDAFGASTSPRLTVAWRPSASLKLRAAAGSAFRAPSTGELYYPFSGNAALEPERSVSYEAGVEWTLSPGLVLETTVFRNDVKDLIRYDFASQTNVNVGRARITGAEAVLRGALSASSWARASYTWLDTEDLDTGLPLLRRPKQRASVTLGQDLGRGASTELTGHWVGERDDVDAATYARVTSPAYFRVDTALTGPPVLGGLSPFARVTNLLDRDYAEVAGFPSPGRRFVAGLDLAF